MAAPSAKKYANRNGYAHAEPAAPRNKFQIPNDRIHEKAGYSRFELPNDVITVPSQKELPILLMLDASPSMGNNGRIGQQNQAVKTFLKALCKNDKVRKVARVAFCLFANGVCYKTDFMKLDELVFPEHELLEGTDPEMVSYWVDREEKELCLNSPVFKATKEDSSNIPDAVIDAIGAMKAYMQVLRSGNRPKYVPFLVFTSDGNPDLTEHYTPEQHQRYMEMTEKAAKAINAVCTPQCDIHDLIIPFFIGIGDADQKYLESFTEHMNYNVLMVDNSNQRSFSKRAQLVTEAIAQSVVMSKKSEDLIKRIDKILMVT